VLRIHVHADRCGEVQALATLKVAVEKEDKRVREENCLGKKSRPGLKDLDKKVLKTHLSVGGNVWAPGSCMGSPSCGLGYF
jgi:hypothetical protein